MKVGLFSQAITDREETASSCTGGDLVWILRKISSWEERQALAQGSGGVPKLEEFKSWVNVTLKDVVGPDNPAEFFQSK